MRWHRSWLVIATLVLLPLVPLSAQERTLVWCANPSQASPALLVTPFYCQGNLPGTQRSRLIAEIPTVARTESIIQAHLKAASDVSEPQLRLYVDGAVSVAETRIAKQIATTVGQLPQRLLSEHAKSELVAAVLAHLRPEIRELREDLQRQIDELRERPAERTGPPPQDGRTP